MARRNEEPDDECPWCGEPIASDAASCPHCGSDEETGWKGDVDYWSLELPEDEESEAEGSEPTREESRAHAARIVGPALVVGAWVTFVAVGASHYRPPGMVLVPATYLAVAIVILSRLAGRWSRPRQPSARARRRRHPRA